MVKRRQAFSSANGSFFLKPFDKENLSRELQLAEEDQDEDAFYDELAADNDDPDQSPRWTKWQAMGETVDGLDGHNTSPIPEDPPIASGSKETPELIIRQYVPLPSRKPRSLAHSSHVSNSPRTSSRQPSTTELDLMAELDLMEVDEDAMFTPKSSRLRPAYMNSSASSSKLPAPSSSSKPRSSKSARPPAPTPIPELVDPDTLPHKTAYAVAQRELKLQRTQADWDKAVELVGAAAVKIVNEIDDELVSVPDGFRYLEQTYLHRVPKVSDGFLFGCNCTASCLDSEQCCGDKETFPFSSRGKFLFGLPRGSLIVECNKNCPCDLKCRNRVVQRPRKIPLEVFKTQRCGWGVRATSDVRRGEVIGIYAGELILRSSADKLTGYRRTYVFDLDHLKGGDEPPPGQQYSVDGYKNGNWGRFINHSCDPNLEAWSVRYDTAEDSRPYLAFIASRPIYANTELTIDYNPTAETNIPPKPKSKKGKSRDGGCMCGTAKCRGVLP